MPGMLRKARRYLETAVDSSLPPKFNHRRAQPRMAPHEVQVARFVAAALSAHDGLDRGPLGCTPALGDAAQRRIVRGHSGATKAEIAHPESVPRAWLGIRALDRKSTRLNSSHRC